MKKRRNILPILLSIVLLSGCLSQEDVKRQEALAAEAIKAKDLVVKVTKDLTELKAKFLAKEITIEDFTRTGIVLKDDLKQAQDAYDNIKEDIEEQRDDGIGWLELAGGSSDSRSVQGHTF